MLNKVCIDLDCVEKANGIPCQRLQTCVFDGLQRENKKTAHNRVQTQPNVIVSML